MPRLVVTAAIGSPVDSPRTPTIGPGVISPAVDPSCTPPIRSRVELSAHPSGKPCDDTRTGSVELYLLQIEFHFT